MKRFHGVGAIIASEETGKVMTVLRSPEESYPNTWTFAGGKVEANETEVTALKRELKEELQLSKIKKIWGERYEFISPRLSSLSGLGSDSR